jgi:hypothetical protein
MKFIQLLNFPAYYKSREKSLNKLVVNKVINVLLQPDFFTISANINNHIPTINIIGNMNNGITPDHIVQISCSCESFKYEFAASINNINALINPDDFNTGAALKKNKFNIPSGCKHIIILARYVWKHRHEIKK